QGKNANNASMPLGNLGRKSGCRGPEQAQTLADLCPKSSAGRLKSNIFDAGIVVWESAAVRSFSFITRTPHEMHPGEMKSYDEKQWGSFGDLSASPNLHLAAMRKSFETRIPIA